MQQRTAPFACRLANRIRAEARDAAGRAAIHLHLIDVPALPVVPAVAAMTAVRGGTVLLAVGANMTAALSFSQVSIAADSFFVNSP